LNETAARAAPLAALIWFWNSCAKKFHSPGCPLTEYIATKLAESIPSLKNLRPIPGPSGALVPNSGLAADESLTIP
jgi:hypothetical protein